MPYPILILGIFINPAPGVLIIQAMHNIIIILDKEIIFNIKNEYVQIIYSIIYVLLYF